MASTYKMTQKLNIATLRAWFLKKGGCIHPAVSIKHDAMYGYSLWLDESEDLPFDSNIIVTPQDLTLSVLDSSFTPEFIDHFSQDLQIPTRFLLMDEYLKGEGSYWSPYLRMLPQPGDDMGTPLFFEGEDLRWLKRTNLEAARKERERVWRSELEAGRGLLRDIHGAGAEWEWEKYTWELYRWAATILTSRCFPQSVLDLQDLSGEDADAPFWKSSVGKRLREQDVTVAFPVLLPVFDLANHDPNARMIWQKGIGSVTLVNKDVIGKGGQVFNNYGPKGNEELLMGYGFTIENNEADTFGLAVASGRSPNLVKAREMQRALRRGNEVPGQNKPEVYHLRLEPTTSDAALVRVMSVMVANKREMLALEVDAEDMKLKTPYIQRNECNVYCSLYMLCTRKIDELREPGNKIAWDNSKTERQKHAARYRESQIEILRSNRTHYWRKYTCYSQDCDANGKTLDLFNLLQSLSRHGNYAVFTAFDAGLRRATAYDSLGELKQEGYEEFVFTMWVRMVVDQMGRKDFVPDCALVKWLQFIDETYQPPDLGEDLKENDTRINLLADKEEYEEGLPVVDSYMTLIEGALDTDMWNPIWTVDQIAWAYMVAQEESCIIPISGPKDTRFCLMIQTEPYPPI